MQVGESGRRSRSFESRWKAGRGFTLIELLVTIAILAIVLALAIPNFTALIISNRLTANANELVGSLQLARSEAVSRNTRVTVCRSVNGTTCTTSSGQGSWVTFVDPAGGNPTSANTLRVAVIKAPVMASNAAARITFRPDGLARTATGSALLATDVVICMPTTQPAENQRVVSIAAGSRVSTESVDGAGACPT